MQISDDFFFNSFSFLFDIYMIYLAKEDDAPDPPPPAPARPLKTF